MQEFFDALGGGKTVLLAISSLLIKTFSQNMANQINNAVTNRAVQQQRLENFQNSGAVLTGLGMINPNPEDENSQRVLNFAQQINQMGANGQLNTEQMEQANQILKEMIENSNAATMAEAELENQVKSLQTALASTFGKEGKSLLPFLEEDVLNMSNLTSLIKSLSQDEIKGMFAGSKDDINNTSKALEEYKTNLNQLKMPQSLK